MVEWPSSEQGTRGFSRASIGTDNSSTCDVFTLACEIGKGKTCCIIQSLPRFTCSHTRFFTNQARNYLYEMTGAMMKSHIPMLDYSQSQSH